MQDIDKAPSIHVTKPPLKTSDLAGSGSKYATPEEMRKLLDKLREDL
jgi:hypothetical protein